MSVAAKQNIRGWKALKPMPQGGRYDHGCCEIDGHRMIIVGGANTDSNILSCGMIYDARTELWTPLPNDMPEPLRNFGIAGNDKYVFVIGGVTVHLESTNTLYRLSLETFEWTTMAPMGTARRRCAAVWKGDYIYVFGGCNRYDSLKSVMRYSIADNAWEPLPDMKKVRANHCAIAGSGSDIYIVGGDDIDDSVDIIDTASLLWKTVGAPCEISGKMYPVAVLLKDHYLVMIGGWDAEYHATSDCLIYDIWSKHWSVTPSSMDMLTPRDHFTAVVLDGKIVVPGGADGGARPILSAESIDIDNLLEYAPLHYPLPLLVFDRILEIGKADEDRGDTGDADEAPRKKAKIIQLNC